MYKSIIVGFDESESSKAALKEAALWIRNHGGSLVMVHAVHFGEEERAATPAQREERLAVGTHVCREAKKKLGQEFGLEASVDSLICEGEPMSVIVDAAQGKGADLIALGTHGRRGLKRLLMGNVTSRTILTATCDVLVVKKPCAQCTGVYHSLLVPYEGSASSEKALQHACTLAKGDGAEVTALYVIPRYEEMVEFFKTDNVKKSLQREAEKILAQAKKTAAELGVEIKTTVQEGHAAERIVEAAETMGHDLIVVGTHGWRGVNKAIMGSTAERVIASAACPILIAK